MKISQYTALAEASSADLLVIVDTADETMAPSGTTKKVTVSGLGAGLGISPPGNAATAGNLSGGATLPAYIAPAVITLSQSGGSVAVDAALGNDFRLLLTASGWTIATPSAPSNGQDIAFCITQDSTGSRTVAWGAGYHFGTAGAPVLSQAPGSIDVIGFKYVAAVSAWIFVGANVPFATLPLTQGGTGQSVSTSAALLAALGAVDSNGGVLGGALSPAVVTLTDAPTTTIDASAGNVFEWPLGGNHTLGIPSTPGSGQVITIDISQPPSGGPFTPTFTTSGAGSFSFGSGGAPSWSTAANALDTVGWRYSAVKSRWLCLGWKTGF